MAPAQTNVHDSPPAQPAARRAPGRWWDAYCSPWFVFRLVCVIPLTLAIGLYFFQRRLIYVPTKAAGEVVAQGFDEQVTPVKLTVFDGLELHGWLVAWDAPGAVAAQPRPTVLFFPGNGGHRGYRNDVINELTQAGFRVAIFDYRGYGENPGDPSEEAIAGDALAEYRYLRGLGAPAEQIVLYGESLGGGPATRLAAELCRQGEPPGGLILQSTFTSLADTAALHFPWLPVRWLLCEGHRNAEQIREVTCPLLVIHGEEDSIVPFAQGQALFAAAPESSANGAPKLFVGLPGVDHNDVFNNPRKAIRAALGRLIDSLNQERLSL